VDSLFKTLYRVAEPHTECRSRSGLLRKEFRYESVPPEEVGAAMAVIPKAAMIELLDHAEMADVFSMRPIRLNRRPWRKSEARIRFNFPS